MSDNNALVPSPNGEQPDKPNDQVMNFAGLFGGDRTPSVASFDLKTPFGRQLLQKCEEAPDSPVREMANLQFRLQHIYAKRVPFVREQTGEEVMLLRICLVTDKGDVHATCSDGIRDAVLRLMAGHGMPPWKMPIPVKVILKQLAGNKQRLTLLEVFEPIPKGGGK